MGLFDQFPYTNFHELNLDWLIQNMKQLNNVYDGLKKEIQETIDFVNNFEQHADQIIDERIVVAMSLYQQRLIQIENLVKQLQDELNADDGYGDQINKLKSDLQQTNKDVAALKAECYDRYQTLIEMMHEYKHSMDGVIDSAAERLEAYIKDTVTKLDRLDVVNPINGVFEDIQNVINDLAQMITRSYGLTAQQYDNLQLTAHVYDSYRITAYDFSTRGYFELYLKLTQFLMRSPFTGDLEPYADIIYELANLHKCGLTAQEYDDRQITAEDYDRFELTAWEYDFFGFSTAKETTAQNYDSLMLTAENYDSKMITAGQYEQGLKWLIDTTLKNSCNNCGDYMLLATQISRLTDRINEYTDKFEEYKPVRIKAGASYVGVLNAGETTVTTITPSLTPDSYVEINTEKKGVYPISINVNPIMGNVVTTWNELDTETMFSVTIQNKA